MNSETIRFGTSSWNYPGWKGLVYNRDYPSEKAFERDCLAEYAANGRFNTVGVDSSFYRPPAESTLERYGKQVPNNFRFVFKVWERLTCPRFPEHPRYGPVRGQVNKDFLSKEIFEGEFLHVLQKSEIKSKIGALVFQFPWIDPELLSATEFYDRLGNFLHALPEQFRYATEIRNKEFLQKEYFGALARINLTHCFNHWTGMPPLHDQMKAAADAGGLAGNFFVSRVLTPRAVSYEQAVRLFQPYQELKRPNPEMRKDITTLVRRAITRGNEAFIIVNNRAEGCAPKTIEAIQEMLADDSKA